MNQTIEYYDENAKAFVDSTLEVDMRHLYARFLPYLPTQGKILDAGCGSGRDVLAFKQRGYSVIGFDASAALVEEARQLTGLDIEQATFTSYSSEIEFDGIWACASLLHVPLSELNAALTNLAAHLRQGGIFYLSFKYGDQEREHNGRCFTDLNEYGLKALLETLPTLKLKESWITGDARPERGDERWLNACLIKLANN